MAVMVGIGKGAEQGILIKNMDSLETLRKIDTVILDKTGTITAGRPTVIRRLWITPDTVRFLNILYTMERSASHPLGEAIARYISELGSEVGMNEVKLSVELIPGKGVKAVGEESIWYAGRSSLFPPQIITDEVAEWISESESEGQTVVIFGSETRIIALFSLSDAIKPGSIRAVTALRKSGIYTIMSTGDNQAAARSVARKAGIYEYYWQSLPQDKLDLVMQKRREGRIVAMVGDGVNDSAALAASHVGIAMGKGSEAAIETASLTIVSGDLEKIPAALKLSADTVAVIRQNLFWAFFYNALAIPIAAGVLYPFCGFLLNPMIAGGAMALSSLSVVMNSLRFNRLKPAS